MQLMVVAKLHVLRFFWLLLCEKEEGSGIKLKDMRLG